MQINYLQKKLYHRPLVDESQISKEAFERLENIKLYDKLRKEGCKESTALEAIGMSRSNYFRWKKRYKTLGIIGVECESKRPNKIRKPQWTAQSELLVLQARKKYYLFGKYKIRTMIKREHNVVLSVSTVGRILKRLMQREKIKPVSYFYGKKDKKNRLFNGHAKRWKKGMKATKIGELIQIDHMDVKLEGGLNIKHFKAICPITKIVVAQIYKRATSDSGTAFLQYALQKFPFPIISIQVDGGSEFMATFEKLCFDKNIDLYVLPPRSPELNCHVERGNGTFNYEFYCQYRGAMNIDSVQRGLDKFLIFYNSERPHQGLQYETPMQYYTQILMRPEKSNML